MSAADRAALDRFGRIDVWVNNAGVIAIGAFETVPLADQTRVVDVNLKGTWNFLKAAARPLMKSSGRIVNVGSIVGLTGNAGQANYAAAKAGIVAMTRSMACEWAGRGVRVNAVAPGFIVTEMTAKMPFGTREIGSRINSLSQGGLPVDVAETIAWLSQPGSAGVNGQTVRVCGQSMLGA